MRVIAAVIGLICLLGSAAMADPAEYVVKKGDSLWKIGRKFGMDWQEIARLNKIEGPKYIIYPQQKLQIPLIRRTWQSVGANPYQGSPEWAIEQFSLPAEVKRQVLANIKTGRFQWLEYGLQDRQELEQVVFGKNQIWHNVLTDFAKGQAYAARDYGIREYRVIQVVKCGNWAWWKKERPKAIRPALVPVVKAPEGVSISKGPALPPSFPPVPRFKALKRKLPPYDKFDLYMGGGMYESVRYNADGWYVWGKARYRPFGFQLSKDISLGLGLFAFGAMGEGHDGGYEYGWQKFAVGPTAKLWGRHWDTDLDFGVGKLWNEGNISLYQSKQEDDIFLLSAHGNWYYRRDKGYRWLPKTEINIEATIPFHSRHAHSWDGLHLDPSPYDNSVFEVFIRQHLYDFKPIKSLLVTPGFNLGGGHEYGTDNNFLQFGPVLTVTYYNEDIVSISPLNYKKILGGDGDQWHWLSGYLNIGGIVKAVHASLIKEATAKDIQKRKQVRSASQANTSFQDYTGWEEPASGIGI